jgi:hypothetical protein
LALKSFPKKSFYGIDQLAFTVPEINYVSSLRDLPGIDDRHCRTLKISDMASNIRHALHQRSCRDERSAFGRSVKYMHQVIANVSVASIFSIRLALQHRSV